MQQHFDVITIGAGNAGFAAARTVHEAGLSVAMIEPHEFGGTCPNRGCTPKKVLVAAAQSLDHIRNAHHHGINVAEPTLDWSALIAREQSLIAAIPQAMEKSAASFATLLKGTATFSGTNQVTVGGQHFSADHIVIATGSKPRPLPIPGAELLVTSDDLLTNPVLPDDIIFVGGGVIALEFAHVFARAGATVTILEALPDLLPRADTEAVQALRQATESLGVRIVTGIIVEGVTAQDNRYAVGYRKDDEQFELLADKVVNGTGRVPAVAQLNLDAANIAHRGTAIELDKFSRSTSNPAIWVAGDVVPDTPQLSPLASDEGMRIGHSIAHGVTEPAAPIIPQVIHTIPALASVGLAEQQAREKFPDLKVQTSDMSDWFSARTYAESTAWAKVLIDGATDLFVGVHLLGHRGEELIHLFALAMQHRIPASSFRQTIYAFPTFASDIKNLQR